MMLILYPFIINGQIIVIEPQNNPFFIIKNIVEGDTIVVDSIPSGLTGYIEKVITQQNFVYKYSNGYGYFRKNFGEYFDLEKFSIANGKLKFICVSSIFAADHKKLFESGLQIEFKNNGIEFRLPAKFHGGIILPFDLYANQKQLDSFLKFLTKLIIKL